jgi:hypothetical protein
MRAAQSAPSERAQKLRRQQLLLRRIEDSVGRVTVNDMTDVASSMVILGIMQMFETKQLALAYLDQTYARMAEIIEQDFDEYNAAYNKRMELH